MLQAYKLNVARSDGYLVWIELEHHDGSAYISEQSRRVLSLIKSINDGSRVWGVVFGHIELKPLYAEIYALGVETLYEVHSRDLVTYHPEAYADSIAKIIVRTEPAAVLFGNSPRAVELAGRIASALDAGAVSGCTSVSADGRKLVFTVPSFSGNVSVETSSFPQIATVMTSMIPSPPRGSATGTVIYWNYDGSGKKEII